MRKSGTDLKIRPIHHYLRHRIEAHISISFIAYTVYKELERIIKLHDKNLSVQIALEEIKTIYGLEYINPLTHKKKFEVLQLNEIQLKIQNIIDIHIGCLEWWSQEKELNLTAGYSITDSLSTSLLYGNISADSNDSTTADNNYGSITVEYTF